MLDRVQIKSEFKNGLRVTDRDTLEIAEMVLSGKINKGLVTHLEQIGTHAVGLSGKDGNMITVEKVMPQGEDIGFVGKITSVDTTLINTLLDQGYTPIVSTIGLDEKYHAYNINADDVATAIARAVKASKLVFLTDIEGVYKDPNDPSTLISELNVSEGKKLMEEGYGVKQGIPQLILAGASVDDVYVIVLFSTFTGMMQGQSTSILSFINIPVSIFLGIGIGLFIGTCLAYYFKKVHIRDTSKVLIILSISLLLVVMEDSLNTAITFSALIAIMFIGIGLQKKREVVAKRISVKYGKLWVAAEVFLFVLVGATVNVGYLGKIGVKALVVIVGALVFRMLGVFVCLLGTSLKKTERLFAMMAYTPKATVQAAIGGIPLAMGFACGDTVLTVAVLAIVLTAPLGAFAIDFSYKKLLEK